MGAARANLLMPKNAEPVATAKNGKAGAARKLDGRPRARSALRARRYKTWKQLHEKTLSLCRAEIRSQDPTFDVAAWEQEARQRVRWLNENEPLRLWEALRDALVAADDYLRKSPSVGDDRNIYADRLDVVLSAPVAANNITMAWPVNMEPLDDLAAMMAAAAPHVALAPLRDCWVHWKEPHPKPGAKPQRDDPEVGLRTWFVHRYRERSDELWWKGLPKVRDLLRLTLLAGFIPRGVKERQDKAGSEADRPTPYDVIDAEERSIRAVLSRLRGKGKGKKNKAKAKAKGPTL
jgi:hypothetical protein